MVSSVSVLTSITSIVTSSVRMLNNHFASVTHVGTMQISPSILLTNVLMVPSFSYNLISISSLLKHISCCLILLGQYLFIQKPRTWTTIRLAKESSGQYFFIPTSTVFQSSCNVSVNNSTALALSIRTFLLG